MAEDLDPVNEVREWRKKMVERWKGKSREEVRKELNELSERFMKEVEYERSRKQEDVA